MSTFTLEHIILTGTITIRFFKAYSHCHLFPDESLQSFVLGTKIEKIKTVKLVYL
jgi:hypothetical protein